MKRISTMWLLLAPRYVAEMIAHYVANRLQEFKSLLFVFVSASPYFWNPMKKWWPELNETMVSSAIRMKTRIWWVCRWYNYVLTRPKAILRDARLTGTQCNFFCLNRTWTLSTWILAILGLHSNSVHYVTVSTDEFWPIFLRNFVKGNTKRNSVLKTKFSGGISKWQSLFCSSF